MIMRKLIFLSVFLICYVAISPVMGQNFLTPVQSLTGDASVVTTSGDEINGDIRLAVIGVRGLKSFTIKEEDGTKHKFKAEDVSHLKVKVDGFAKLEMIGEKASTLKNLTSDFDEVAQRDYIIYEKVQIPGKDKYVLAQLLNPGWDNKIKVYHNPLGGEKGTTSIGGIGISGGDEKTYIVLANEDPSFILKKGKYVKKDFTRVFGSCEHMMNNFEGKDRDFKNFAIHVFAHYQECD